MLRGLLSWFLTERYTGRFAGKVTPAQRSLVVRLFVGVPFIALAMAVIVIGLSSDRAWPVAAFLLIGSVILVVPTDAWQKLLSSVEKAQIGPFSFGLRQHAEKAALIAPPSDKGEGVEDEATEDAQSVFDLRMQLEWKLAFIAKHLLATGSGVTFVTIGSLKFDGYLTEPEARTATGIMLARDEELRELPASERRKFISEAQDFLDGLRTSVFWGRIKRELEGKDDGAPNLLRDSIPGTGGRNDLRAARNGASTRIVPVLALNSDSTNLKQAIERLEEGALPGPETERQLIVVPDSTESKVPRHATSNVVELGELRKALASP